MSTTLWRHRETREEVDIVGGQFLLRGKPWQVRGATYGSFAPRDDGALFPAHDRVVEDMAAMASAGLNMVRTYTTPTRDVLDAAWDHGLRVIAGIYYDDWRTHPAGDGATTRRVLRSGRAALAAALDVIVDHPATFAVCIGNEVPSDVVRLVGARTVERVLSTLVEDVHAARKGLKATYATYPTTEYLRVEHQDFVSINVFLEDPDRLRSYLRRLQVQAAGVPVLLSEIGLASEVHGEAEQAAMLSHQLRVVDEVGLAGACVFSWTDEWAVDAQPITGWGFGVTTEDRHEKLALREIREWALRPLHALRDTWPCISVVVCAYNEERTIAECLLSLAATDYPNLEVVVCDDGSHDRTLARVRALVGTLPPSQAARFTVLALPHGGLSQARNAGLAAAAGDIVAYLDADAACLPDWPYHLALSLEDPNVVATGGPNLPVPRAGLVERAVAVAPGSPQHVLISHDRAEHVAGCNMAFRRKHLEKIGGFNTAYTSAGDDVDVCWKLQDRGCQIGFAPAAVVLHHRRDTVGGYVRQQRGYGRSEAMLSGPHAHRFNPLGQARWRGVIYTSALRRILRPVVYHGSMGTAAYQPATRLRGQRAVDWVGALLPATVPAAAAGGLLAAVAHPAWLLLTALALLSVAGYASAVVVAVRPPHDEAHPVKYRLLAAWLHVVQPIVRAWGRLRARPLPPDPKVAEGLDAPWSGDRVSWLHDLQIRLNRAGLDARAADAEAEHDLVVRRTPLATARVTTAVLWSWTPVARVRTRPTSLVAACLVGSAVLGFVAPSAALSAAVATIALTAVDVAGVHRRVAAQVTESTAGAGAVPARRPRGRVTCVVDVRDRDDTRLRAG